MHKKFVFLERSLVSGLASNIFGYDSMLVGDRDYLQCLEQSKIKNKYLLSREPKELSVASSVPELCSRLERFPIESEVMDLVYLAHCLEFSPNPQEILQETFRVLRPDGRVLISLFNPWCLWRARGIPNYISLRQLKDWLAGLGFDIMRVNHFGFCMPVFSNAVMTKLPLTERWGQKSGLAFGAAYVVEAGKATIPITPVKASWSTENVAIASDAVEPTL